MRDEFEANYNNVMNINSKWLGGFSDSDSATNRLTT